MRWFKKEVAYREASFKESTGNESVHMLGQGAKSIIENEAFDAAFKKIEADLTGLWKASNPNQSEAREYVLRASGTRASQGQAIRNVKRNAYRSRR